MDLAREPDFELGVLRVRPSVRQVEFGRTSETLEPRILQVLVALARKRGEVISRDELIETCWNGVVVGEDSLNRCIYRLRKLGESSGAFRLETIPRVGYRLWAAGEPVRSDGQSAPESTPISAPAPKLPTALSRRTLTYIGAAILAGVVAVAIWFGVLNSRTVVVAAAPVIAVLPFDATGGADAEALARQAPGAIADALAANGETVVSPSLGAPSAAEDSAETAKKRHAAYLIDGEVILKDGRVRLNVRISNDAGVALGMRSVNARQDSASSLPYQAGLLTANAFYWLRSLDDRYPTATAEQKALLLRTALSIVNGDQLTAFDASRRQLKSDPNNSYAQANFAISGAIALADLPPDSRAATLAELRAVSKRLEAANPPFKDVSLATSSVLPQIDFAGREALLRKGLLDFPDNPNVRGWVTGLLRETGRNAEAVEYALEAFKVDPMSPVKATNFPRAALALGRYEEALASSESALAKFPNSPGVISTRFGVLLWSRHAREALDMLSNPEIRDLIDPPAQSRPAELLARALDSGDARDVDALRAACADPARLVDAGRGLCLTGLGALAQLDAAFIVADAIYPEMRGRTPQERDARWIENPDAIASFSPILFYKGLAPMRADRRIIPVFERLGLIDYWRSTGKWPDFCRTEPDSVCNQMQAK